ncbi:Calycin-like domain and Calycin domain-containing protein [Aphelenchoides fujianensis]|nr:Calycin-like domain and Calycin domain-containing protein [Aphelenchoides fujianensis]
MAEEIIFYVGSYTEVDGADGKPQLEVCSRRAEKNVTFFLVDRQRGKLYAISEAKPPLSALHRFDIGSDGTGTLSNHVHVDFTEAGGCFIGGLRAQHGALLAIPFYDSGVVRVVEDDAEQLIPHEPLVFHKKSGCQIWETILLHKIHVHGKKAKVVHEISLPAGSGPRHVLKHPTLDLLFVISELANTLAVFTVDGSYEELIRTDEHSTSRRRRAELQDDQLARALSPAFFSLVADRWLLVANQLSHSLLLFEFNQGRVHGPIARLEIPSPAALAVFPREKMPELNEKQRVLLGKWQLEYSSPEFDDYMKAIGINAIKRALGKNTKPVVTISLDGDVWTVLVQSTFKNDKWTFKLNERFEQTTIDGRKFWCTVTLTEDGKIIEKQTNIEGDSSVPSIITRYVEDGKLVALSLANDVQAKRVYGRIE